MYPLHVWIFFIIHDYFKRDGETKELTFTWFLINSMYQEYYAKYWWEYILLLNNGGNKWSVNFNLVHIIFCVSQSQVLIKLFKFKDGFDFCNYLVFDGELEQNQEPTMWCCFALFHTIQYMPVLVLFLSTTQSITPQWLSLMPLLILKIRIVLPMEVCHSIPQQTIPFCILYTKQKT